MILFGTIIHFFGVFPLRYSSVLESSITAFFIKSLFKDKESDKVNRILPLKDIG